MFNSEAIEIKVSFSIPEWFPPDRLDYSKAHHYDQSHAYAGSYDHSTYHNSAEDNLWNQFKDIKEMCNYYWIEIEYDGSPEHLSDWIETMKGKLNRFFRRYKEGRK